MAPDLVVRDEQDRVYTVRYEAVNAMLLNEFLKQHRKMEEQEQTLAAQELALASQNARLQVLEQSVAELKAIVEALAQKGNGGAQ